MLFRRRAETNFFAELRYAITNELTGKFAIAGRARQHARRVRYPSCRAMLAPTQVLSMLKSTPIILP